MKKKNFLLVSFATTLALGIGLALTQVFHSNKLLAGRATECTHETVEHYAGVAPTLESAGRPEHWACCECHKAWYDEARTQEIVGRESDYAIADFAKKTAMTPITKDDLNEGDYISALKAEKVKWTEQNDIVNSPKASSQDRMEYYSIDGKKAVRFSFDYDGLSADDKCRIHSGTTDPSAPDSTGGNVANAGYTEMRFMYTGNIWSFTFDYKYWDLNRDVYSDGGDLVHTMAQSHDSNYNYEEMTLVNDNQWHQCTVTLGQRRNVDFVTLKIQHFHGELFLTNLQFDAHDHAYKYTFDKTNEKIIKTCTVCAESETITPDLYVPRLHFHANNQNVVQFKMGAFEGLITGHSTILNLSEGFSSSFVSTISQLHYFDDSKTLGYYQDGICAGVKQGDTFEFNDLIFTQGDKYYVIGYAGAVYSATVEKFLNINGEVKNSSIGWAADNNGWNYINLDADFTVETNYWNLTDTSVGETWTSGGGTNFKVKKVISGVESDYFECTKGFEPRGAAPEFAEIDLYYNKETTKQKLRISFPTEGLTAGDKYILKAGATFTDTAFHAVLLREDAEFIFNGSTINLNLGNVDLSCATPSAWANPFSFSIPSLVFDMTNRNGDGNYEANPASQSNGVANFSMISFVLTDTNDVKYTNVSNRPQYFNMSALLGMQGTLAFTDHTIAVGDIVTIPTGSYITVPGCGTYLVSQGVSMRATAVASPNITWVIAN